MLYLPQDSAAGKMVQIRRKDSWKESKVKNNFFFNKSLFGRLYHKLETEKDGDLKAKKKL